MADRGDAQPRLTARAVAKVEETIEAEREFGDSELATALDLLLQWYREAANGPS